ncbi:MAG: hypothetical protein CFE45_24005, partial [Burkholderiales bacterium PBB5]
VTEGIPLGFAATAVATQLRRQDVGPAEIGAFVGSFYLPWAFKWAFGPIIDVFTSERLGRRRGWILGTQLMLIITLLSCTALNLPAQLGVLTGVLLVHNSFGAMQDVAIDALAVNTLAEDERGLANGVMFAGAAIGTAVGGSGVLFLMPVIGLSGGFVFVAGCIALVTVCIVLPLKEAPTPHAERRAAGLGAALAEMKQFSMQAFRSFLGTRGAFAGVFFALLPAGAMSLGLALQSNLSVEVGMNDDEVAWLQLWTNVISAAAMVIGGLLSDKWGRRKTLFVYLALMSLPVLYLMGVLIEHQWIFPAAQGAGAVKRVAPAALVTAVWTATLLYAVANGLMYGTRTAIFMDVTNPAVAYPKTLLIDAITGPLCLLLLPLIKPSPSPSGDGGGSGRARALALGLALACLAWLPYRAGWWSAGSAAPIFETLFTLVFVASAVFLAAGSAVLGGSGGRLGRWGLWLALPLLAMYLRHSVPQAGVLYSVVPALAALLLLAQSRLPWQVLRTAEAA